MGPELEFARAALLSGDVIGLPTETVYGLAADATNRTAVAKIFAIKGRPTGHPLILHVGEASWLDRYCRDVPPEARLLARTFWPGPLSMVLYRDPTTVPDEVTGGLPTVAVRHPAHAVALALLRLVDRPLAAPSANRFGAVSPTTREHVLHDFGDVLSIVLEGGACEIGLESTIIDLTGTVPRLLRPGAVTRTELESALGCRVYDNDGSGAAAPGTLASHYSPRARVEVLPTLDDVQSRARELLEETRSIGVIVNEPLSLTSLEARVRIETLEGGQQVLAHELYAALRRLDGAGCDVILTRLPPPEGLGEAIRDRLERAAAPRS